MGYEFIRIASFEEVPDRVLKSTGKARLRKDEREFMIALSAV
jgi:hypothetical protein